MRLLSLFALAALPCLALAAPESPAPPTDLVEYVTKKDASFSWKLSPAWRPGTSELNATPRVGKRFTVPARSVS